MNDVLEQFDEGSTAAVGLSDFIRQLEGSAVQFCCSHAVTVSLQHK
jgi:hypothetical protein